MVQETSGSTRVRKPENVQDAVLANGEMGNPLQALTLIVFS